MTGYLSFEYAHALSEWGVPRGLPRSGGWVLERAIPGSERVDACGIYPLLCCRDWTALAADLDAVEEGWVSLVAVIDPLGSPSSRQVIREAFSGEYEKEIRRYLRLHSGLLFALYISRGRVHSALQALRGHCQVGLRVAE